MKRLQKAGTLQKSKRWLMAVCIGLLMTGGADVIGGAAGTALAATGTAVKDEESGPGVYGVNGSQTKAAQAEASLERWELKEDGGWYYYGPDGNPGSGWTIVDNKYFYLTETGRCLMNTITPDGYYVNPNGVWQTRSAVILDTEFKAPEKVLSVTSPWTGAEAMKSVQQQILSVFSQRRIRVTDYAMEYLAGEDDTVLLGIYKNTSTGAYRLDIRTTLDKSSTAANKAATYDYAVFKAFLYQLTTTPDYLEDAIYSSWQEDNRWGINRNTGVWVGDSQVKYTAGAGCGYYHIYPAGQK